MVQTACGTPFFTSIDCSPHCRDVLQKEERTHDEKLSAANARIKQAGQLYEKKVKKNPADAVEEHTRYMNLLSSLGPEISQEKQSEFFLRSHGICFDVYFFDTVTTPLLSHNDIRLSCTVPRHVSLESQTRNG